MRRLGIITSAVGLLLVGSSVGGDLVAADSGPTCEGYKDVANHGEHVIGR
jgi:hypothetical protein